MGDKLSGLERSAVDLEEFGRGREVLGRLSLKNSLYHYKNQTQSRPVNYNYLSYM